MAGGLLKILFGTATLSDLNVLHSTLDTLSKDQETVSHAVNQQINLFKQLDKAVNHNQGTLTNLTSIVKDYVLKVQNKFVNTMSKLE